MSKLVAWLITGALVLAGVALAWVNGAPAHAAEPGATTILRKAAPAAPCPTADAFLADMDGEGADIEAWNGAEAHIAAAALAFAAGHPPEPETALLVARVGKGVVVGFVLDGRVCKTAIVPAALWRTLDWRVRGRPA